MDSLDRFRCESGSAPETGPPGVEPVEAPGGGYQGRKSQNHSSTHHHGIILETTKLTNLLINLVC